MNETNRFWKSVSASSELHAPPRSEPVLVKHSPSIESKGRDSHGLLASQQFHACKVSGRLPVCSRPSSEDLETVSEGGRAAECRKMRIQSFDFFQGIQMQAAVRRSLSFPPSFAAVITRAHQKDLLLSPYAVKFHNLMRVL